MELILKICECFRIIDFPTAYIMIFTGAWLLVLIAAVAFVKPKNPDVYRILGFIPLLHFAVFYLLNYTKGYFMLGFSRYGWFLIAAFIYALAGLIIARKEKKVRHLVITGVLNFITFSLSVIYIMGISHYARFTNYSHMNYEQSMAAVIDEIEGHYILSEHKQIDYDALRAKYIPMAAEADLNGDEEAYAEAVMNLCYEFHDGHLSAYFLDNDLRSRVNDNMLGNDYGFSMISTDSGVTVAILTAGDSDAYALGIHDGTVITGWDGTDIDEALRNVSCVTTGWPTPSFPTSENEDFMRPIFLAGNGGDTVKVRFIGDDGKETEVTLESNGSYYNRFMAAMKPVTGKRCDEFAYCEMLDDRCGYLCIPEEEYDTSGDIIAALTDDYPAVKELLISRIDQMRSQGMDRLIIDLRDNDGGLDVISAAVASLFTTEEIRTYSGFISGGKLVETKYWKWTVPADGRYSDIPVVVLVNAGTASAGDILTYNLSTCPNVTVMGITTSWGCAQGVAQTCLLSGGSIRLRYSIMATLDKDRNIYIDPGPDRISGITLDEKIPFDMDAVNKIYVQGQDYELEYALDWIEREER